MTLSNFWKRHACTPKRPRFGVDLHTWLVFNDGTHRKLCKVYRGSFLAALQQDSKAPGAKLSFPAADWQHGGGCYDCNVVLMDGNDSETTSRLLRLSVVYRDDT